MTAKKLNVHLLAWVLVPLALLGVGTHFLHSYQIDRHAETLRAQARAAEEAGDLGRASTCLHRYLVFAPRDTAALLHYAQLLDRRADTPDARWYAAVAYQKVLLRQSSRHEIRRRLIDLLMSLGVFTDARDHLEVLLQLRPRDGELEELLGCCQEACGDRNLAATSYQSAITHTPTRLTAYLRLARLEEYGLGAPNRAAEVLDRLVRANPNRFEAYLERALWSAAHAALDEAAADLARALELAPKDERVLLAAADLALRRGRADEASAHLRRGRELHPRHAGMHLRLAALELRHRRTPAALACLHEGLKALPDHPALLDLLAEVQIDRDERSAAADTIARVRRTDAPRADYLSARLLSQRRQWAAAGAILEGLTRVPALPPELAARAWVALGVCRGQLGDPDRRLTAFEKAVALDPGSATARLALGTVLLDAGRTEEAVTQLRRATELPDAPESAWMLLGRALVRRAPAGPPPGEEGAEMRRVLERAQRGAPDAVPVILMRADILAAGGQTEEARGLLEKTLARRPGEASLWIALARLAARRGDRDAAAHLLNDARYEIGDRVEFRLVRLEVRDRRVGRDALPQLRELQKGIDGFAPGDQVRLLCGVARACYETGNFGEGDRLCRALASRPATRPVALIPVLDLVLEAGDAGVLAQVLARLRRLEGETGTWWRYGEAAGLLRRAVRGDKAAFDQAAALLTVVQRTRPDWSRAILLQAQLDDVRGNRTAAVDSYRRAFDLGEHEPAVVARLLALLAERGRYADADQVVRRLQQETVLRGNLPRLAAEVALQVHSYDRARELARQAVADDATDFRDHVWLGGILGRAGKRDEAEAAFRRAVHLAPDSPGAWLALVAFLAHSGQRAEGRAALDEMRTRVTLDQVLPALARGYDALGDVRLAEATYRQALAQSPEAPAVLRGAAEFHLRRNRPRLAEPLLRRLLAQANRLPLGELAWARRQLALALPAAEEGYREALALLARNAKEGLDSVADRRARALVEGTRPAGRSAALRTLEESRQLAPLAPDEQFRLALLYEADGQDGRAVEQYIDLLALDAHNPEYLARYVANLLRRGKSEEARMWLARLAEIEPGSARVKEFEEALLRLTGGAP